jgi:hypothetical protein
MMDGVAVDIGGHGVLEGEEDKLHAVLPAKALDEQSPHPLDEFALARPWKTMHQVEQGLFFGGRFGFLALFPGF